jgi:TRAP-type mannitol/chloroaromatic compound transport system substrate-binding protein
MRSGWLAAGAAAVMLCAAMPAPAAAQQPPQGQKLRFQGSFPGASTFMDTFRFYVERVKTMSGGRLEIEALPAGTLVPAFEVLDAVHKKVIDGGHTASAYWVGKNKAGALFGPTPGGPFGFDILDYQSWLYHGGGLDLYREFYQVVLQRNVEPMPLGTVANQALGWFKNPVKSWDDLKGRKCRQTGITAEVFSRAGMAVVNMPGGEIVPAGERGVIDCAEWVGPGEDMKLGLHTIWKFLYMPSTHEPATSIELLVNGDTWKAMAPDLRAIMQTAVWEATWRGEMLIHKQNADAMKELREKHGVRIERTPDDVLRKTLEAWEEIAKAESAKNPFFKKVLDSQRAWAEQVVQSRRAVALDYSWGANYYWPEKK